MRCCWRKAAGRVRCPTGFAEPKEMSRIVVGDAVRSSDEEELRRSVDRGVRAAGCARCCCCGGVAVRRRVAAETEAARGEGTAAACRCVGGGGAFRCGAACCPGRFAATRRTATGDGGALLPPLPTSLLSRCQEPKRKCGAAGEPVRLRRNSCVVSLRCDAAAVEERYLGCTGDDAPRLPGGVPGVRDRCCCRCTRDDCGAAADCAGGGGGHSASVKTGRTTSRRHASFVASMGGTSRQRRVCTPGRRRSGEAAVLSAPPPPPPPPSATTTCGAHGSRRAAASSWRRLTAERSTHPASSSVDSESLESTLDSRTPALSAVRRLALQPDADCIRLDTSDTTTSDMSFFLSLCFGASRGRQAPLPPPLLLFLLQSPPLSPLFPPPSCWVG